GLHQVAVELGVHDGLIGVVEVLDATLPGEGAREGSELLGAGVARQGDRINRVVEGEVEAGGVGEFGAAEEGVGAVHAVACKLAGDSPVHADLEHVSGLDPETGKADGVMSKDLLSEGHGARGFTGCHIKKTFLWLVGSLEYILLVRSLSL